MAAIFKDQIYTLKQLKNLGLEPGKTVEIDMDVFEKDDKLYFFESLAEDTFRLFTIISNSSFYMK